MTTKPIIIAATALCASLIAAYQTQQPAGRLDYLSAELRASVEKIKREPVTRANMISHAMVLYDWVNAYSLTGGAIPVNATQQLSPVFAAAASDREGAPGAAGQFAALARNLEALIYEFKLKDERPKASR